VTSNPKARRISSAGYTLVEYHMPPVNPDGTVNYGNRYELFHGDEPITRAPVTFAEAPGLFLRHSVCLTRPRTP